MLAAAAAAIAAAAGLAFLLAERGDARPELQRELDGLVTGAAPVAPGAAAYVEGPRGAWSGAAGLADVEARRQMRPEERFRLQSVSKAWTATVLLQLVDEGRLALDDTVEERLPGLLPDGSRITVRRLLNHTSGLIDTSDVALDPVGYLDRIADPALRARLLRLKDSLEADPTLSFSPRRWIELAAALPLRSEPGSEFHYSNIGYEVAGEVAAAVGGEELAALYERWIIEPLGLESAAYDPRGPIEGPHATGYALVAGNGPTDATELTGGVGAAGGIVANARDEARFLVALMRGELLEPEQLRAMLTPPRELGSGYGLGLGEAATSCGPAYNHNGAGAGFKTSVLVSRDGGRVAVLLLNGNSAGADAAAYAAVERLYCAA
jgi:D-alanyl-D-alanine carboxypeptidase